jgi:ketosteroid isomerase-like protein
MEKSQWLKITILNLLIFFCCTDSDLKISKIQTDILNILNEQKALWNIGDIEGFMKYYWQSKDLTFQSGNKRLQGWDELLSMYKNNYGGENMGELGFTDIEIQVLSDELAYVLGRWKVTTKESVKEGLFTLIFRKFNEGWRIIVDHSS